MGKNPKKYNKNAIHLTGAYDKRKEYYYDKRKVKKYQ